MRFTRGQYLYILSPAIRPLSTATISIDRNSDRDGISLFAALLYHLMILRSMRSVSCCGLLRFALGRISNYSWCNLSLPLNTLVGQLPESPGDLARASGLG